MTLPASMLRAPTFQFGTTHEPQGGGTTLKSCYDPEPVTCTEMICAPMSPVATGAATRSASRSRQPSPGSEVMPARPLPRARVRGDRGQRLSKVSLMGPIKKGRPLFWLVNGIVACPLLLQTPSPSLMMYSLLTNPRRRPGSRTPAGQSAAETGEASLPAARRDS